jgi:hypothetical protein
MTIATENVSVREIENGNQADDHPNGNGNQSGNVSESVNGIVEMNVEIPRIVQDIKEKQDIDAASKQTSFDNMFMQKG